MIPLSLFGSIAAFFFGEQSPVPTPTVPMPTPIPNPRPTAKPVAMPTPSVANNKTFVSSAVALEVSKAVTQIERWADALDQRVFNEQMNSRVNWLHDLEIMRARQDLKFVSLELLDGQKKVIGGFQITFDQCRVSPKQIVDVGRGIENPASTSLRRIIKSNRLVINGSSKRADYSDELRISWSTAEKLVEVSKVQFVSDHARKITGGRLAGTIAIAESAMETLVIKNAGNKSYAFASSIDDPVNHGKIFLLKRYAPANTVFVPGARFRGIVIQTPAGLQGRHLTPC